MVDIYLELLPIFLLILVGQILKRLGIVKNEEASLFLRLVFYVAMPALVLSNIPYINISTDLLYLPVIPFILAIVLFAINRAISVRLKLSKKTLGVFIISSLILNTAFVLPFISIIYGDKAVSQLLILDVGNAVVVFVFAYQQACKYGGNNVSTKELAGKFLKAVPLWAILIALVMNFANIQFYPPLFSFLKMTGDITIPLLLISVGVFFEPKLSYIKLSSIAIFIRMGLGLLSGIAIATAFGLENDIFKIAVIGCSTPIGYNVLTFSSIENLDKKFAANLVSSSILFAFLFVPVLIYVLNL